MFHPLAHLDDPVSRVMATAGAGGGSILAFAAASPTETILGLLAAVLTPLAISAINRFIADRSESKGLRAALLAAEAARTIADASAEALRRRLAELEPTAAPPEA